MDDSSTNVVKQTNETINKLKTLYLKSGYMEKYGSDVWVSAILCFVFVYLICYYYYANVLQVVKADWQIHKCNPLFIPFAGFINSPTDKTNLEFTAENFSGCVNSILKDIVEVAVHPFIFMVNILQEACQSLVDSVNLGRKLSYNIRMEFINTVQRIYDALMNTVAYFIMFIIKIKDSIEKVKGIMAACLYSIFGSYMAMQSLFGGIVDLLNKFMIYGAHLILMCILATIGLLASFFFSFLAPIPAWAGWTMFIPWLILLIPILIYKYLMLYYLSIPTPPMPDTPDWSPVCFSGETIIDILETTNKNNCIPTLLKNIKVGDTLKNGEKVTAVIKGSSVGQTVYELDGILVTSEHRVYEPSLKWIKVKNHPKAKIVKTFNDPFVYCLGTDQKEFMIGDILFSDWDDVDENVLSHLQEKCVNNGNTYLPAFFKLSDIHTHLDSGFTSDTKIVLNNGSTLPISEIKVDDELLNGIKVIAVVKIYASDMDIYTHQISNTISIRGSKNIHINDSNLGEINCMNLNSSFIDAKEHNEAYLYHLLTDEKQFMLSGVFVNDYNSGIDLYLK